MCFSFIWVEQVLIWLVVLCAVIALLRLVVTYVLPQIGLGDGIVSLVTQAIRIVIWAIVLIAVIVFMFDLISCLIPSGIPRIH